MQDPDIPGTPVYWGNGYTIRHGYAQVPPCTAGVDALLPGWVGRGRGLGRPRLYLQVETVQQCDGVDSHSSMQCWVSQKVRRVSLILGHEPV